MSRVVKIQHVKSSPPGTFVKEVLLNNCHSHLLCIIYDCLHTTMAELNTVATETVRHTKPRVLNICLYPEFSLIHSRICLNSFSKALLVHARDVWGRDDHDSPVNVLLGWASSSNLCLCCV